MRQARAIATIVGAAFAVVASILVAPPPATADDWSTLPPCQWTLADGPLRIGCTAGLIPPAVDPSAPPGSPTVEVLAVISTDTSIVDAIVVTGANPWGPNSVRIRTKAPGTARVCMAFRATKSYPAATIASTDPGLSENCVEVAVGTDGEPNCHPKILTEDGYWVETGHIHLGCVGYGLGCTDCVVTDSWSTNPAVLRTWVQPNPTPQYGGPPNTAIYDPVGPGKAAVCWTHVPRPGIAGDGGPYCSIFSVHPLTANISDTAAYPKGDNMPQCKFAEGALTAYLQVGCWTDFGTMGGASITSSSPTVADTLFNTTPSNLATGAFVRALRPGTTEVCRRDSSGAVLGACVTVTVVTPDTDVSKVALTYPAATSTSTSSSPKASSSSPDTQGTQPIASPSAPVEPTVVYTSDGAQVRVAPAKGSTGSVVVRAKARKLANASGSIIVKRWDASSGRLRVVTTQRVRFDARGSLQRVVRVAPGDLLLLVDGKDRRVAVVRMRT